MPKNINLHNANLAKNDDFYTMLSDIEKYLVHYKPFFKDKTVYCNCDVYRISNFVTYFLIEFWSHTVLEHILNFYVFVINNSIHFILCSIIFFIKNIPQFTYFDFPFL